MEGTWNMSFGRSERSQKLIQKVENMLLMGLPCLHVLCVILNLLI